jgi:hypothetical protein
MNLFTSEDMLRFLYNEMTREESLAMQKALDADWKLRECLDEMKQLLGSLDSVKRSPRPQSVDAIMKYAGAEAVKTELH